MTSLILPMDVVEELQERDRQEALRQQQEQAALMGAMGVKTRLHYDEQDDRLIVERVSDAEGAIEFAQAARCAHPRNGYSPDRSIRHVGEIDVVTIERWVNEGRIESINDNAGIRRMLTDSDYSRFRTVDKL